MSRPWCGRAVPTRAGGTAQHACSSGHGRNIVLHLFQPPQTPSVACPETMPSAFKLHAGVSWVLQLLFLVCVAVAAATQSIHTYKSTLAAQGAVVVSACMAGRGQSAAARDCAALPPAPPKHACPGQGCGLGIQTQPAAVSRCDCSNQLHAFSTRHGMQSAPNRLLALPPPPLSPAQVALGMTQCSSIYMYLMGVPHVSPLPDVSSDGQSAGL